MKRLNIIEAASVIGGTCETCTSSYEAVVIGGVTSCKEVTTCTDKYGNNTITMKDAADSTCFVPNR